MGKKRRGYEKEEEDMGKWKAQTICQPLSSGAVG